jgi:hypothetical protein
MTENEEAQAPKQVEETGFALVHEREWIFPEKEALARLRSAGPTVVNYHFPVEIEVIGTAGQAEEYHDALRVHLESI